MIDRERPERPPYIPTWVLPAVGAVVAVFILAAGLVLWLSVRAEVVVPDVVGVDEAVAEVRLAQAGLTIEVTERPFDASEVGTVLDQDPPAGESLKEGEAVRLVVSAGTEEFSMPDVIGLSVRIARVQLEERGLTVRIDEVDSDAPEDTVISSNPSPGARLRSSDMVRLTVAKKSDASDALLPYKLAGTVVAIDPTAVPAGAKDATMEVARRLRALLEASGATVIVTRSSTDTGTTSPPKPSTEITGSVSAIVGLDVAAAGSPGLAVLTLSSSSGSLPSAVASNALADEVTSQLAKAGKSAARDTVNTDGILSSAPNSPGVRVRLGSSASKSDTSDFADPIWFDTIARAVYKAIGERLGAK